jgi:hypothetical protein
MAPGLDRARTAGLPAYLETTNPGNLDLYRRAGWEVLDTLMVGPVRVWTMVHYHRRVRSAFVHEATIELLSGADAAAPGAAVKDAVRQRIVAALASGRLAAGSRESRWTTTRQGAATIEPSEQTLAAQLVAG